MLQVDDKQAVFEASAHVVGEREPSLEVASRDAAMQEGPFFLFGLAALERKDVLLDRELDFIRLESRERDRDPEAVLVEAARLNQNDLSRS